MTPLYQNDGGSLRVSLTAGFTGRLRISNRPRFSIFFLTRVPVIVSFQYCARTVIG